MEHINYKDTRLNVEPKTQRSHLGNAGSGSQMNARNNSYQSRGGGGGGSNRGGNRGGYFRGNTNNQRRSGGQYRNNSPSFMGRDENYKGQQQ